MIAYTGSLAAFFCIFTKKKKENTKQTFCSLHKFPTLGPVTALSHLTLGNNFIVLFWCVEIFSSSHYCFNYLNPSDNATLSLAKLQITAGHFGAVGYRQMFGFGFTALSPFLYLVQAFKGCPFPLHPFCLYSHCTAVTVLLPVTFCCMSCYLNLPSHFLSHRLHCTTAPSPPRSRSIHQSLL